MQSSWIELSQHAFNHNVSQFRSFLSSHVLLSCVLKSNAYGHGLIEMGQLCEQNNEIDYVCVFFLKEALTLRKTGLTKPILVLGYNDDEIEKALDYSIDLVCHSESQLADYHRAALKKQKKINIHIKVDTGLSRLGFFPEEVLSIFEKIKAEYSWITCKGLMTHFSESGSLDLEWTERQERIFLETMELLKNKNLLPPLVHSSNTGATLRFPSSHLSMVRIGGGVYGLPQRTYVYDLIKEKNPSFNLKPVLTLKSKIISIKTLPAGSFVSYDRLYQAPTPKKVAIVPIGYSDGYGRRKPIGLHVLIHNVLAPVLGSVCMNMIMIDISHISSVHIGSEVVAIGDTEGIRVNDIAPLIGCVNYEVTTSLNQTIPRSIIVELPIDQVKENQQEIL